MKRAVIRGGVVLWWSVKELKNRLKHMSKSHHYADRGQRCLANMQAMKAALDVIDHGAP